MTFKKYYSWQDVEHMVSDICRQITLSGWRPDYVVGITRGGNVPATMISQYFGCRCEALKVKLRDVEDGESCESNCWMAEDAFGYEEHQLNELQGDISASAGEDILQRDIKGMNILIVDDINDTGATFNWIMDDWQSSCLPNNDRWDNVWGNNVRFAVLTDNLSSEFNHCVSYYADEVNKAEDPVWLVYSWEEWWKS